MTKPDCYKCQFRGNTAGSHHSSCHHPANKQLNEDPLAALFALLGKRAPALDHTVPGINVTGNPHGIRNGWFAYPFNFDPIWLESCDGFAEKESNQ